jgi:hypothetical protein
VGEGGIQLSRTSHLPDVKGFCAHTVKETIAAPQSPASDALGYNPRFSDFALWENGFPHGMMRTAGTAGHNTQNFERKN